MLLVVRNILFLLCITLVFSCKHKTRQKPFAKAKDAFFVTSNVSVITTSAQGYPSHNITDIWLYTNGFFRGAYPVGSKMPVMIDNGKSVMDVFAGIKNNGISKTRINWLMYEPIKLDTVVEAGNNIVRNFTFRYRPSVVFPWVETFEGNNGLSLIRSAISDTSYKTHVNDGDIFEGIKSIEFGLAGSALTAQLETANSYSLPLSSANVYLEMDYKCNCEFEVGTSTSGVYYNAIVVGPKDDWHKIYIQLSESISKDKSTSMKKVIFKIIRNTTIAEQKVYLDNLKLVYIP